MPSADFAINQAWLTVVLIAGDLLAAFRGFCLEGDWLTPNQNDSATACSTRLGLLVRSARRTTLRIAEGWPWAQDLVAAFRRLPNWAIA